MVTTNFVHGTAGEQSLNFPGDEIEQAVASYLMGGRAFALALVNADVSIATASEQWREVYRLNRVKLRMQRRLFSDSASSNN